MYKEEDVKIQILKQEQWYHVAPSGCCHGGTYNVAPAGCCHGGTFNVAPAGCCHGRG